METSVTKHFFMYGWKKKFLPCCASVGLLLYLLHTKLPIFGQNWKGKQDRRQILNQDNSFFWGVVTDH